MQEKPRLRAYPLAAILILALCWSLPETLFAQQTKLPYRYETRLACANPASVTHLDLSYRHLQSLDTILLRFPNLQKLEIQGNNLSVLPPVVQTLSRLEYLDISYNTNLNTASVFAALMNLPLKELKARGCYLAYLPENSPLPNTLEALDLSGNILSTLPPAILGLPSLVSLDLSHNDLDSLPNLSLQECRLQHIDLSGNPCINLATTYRRLGQLPMLHAVAIRGIRDMPSAISQLTTLESIDISSSPIRNIHAALGGLPQLKRINFTYCPNLNMVGAFTTLAICRTMEDVTFGYAQNKVEEVPEGLMQIKGLRKLSILHGFKMPMLPLFNSLATLPYLEELTITGGNMESIPNEVFKLVHLKKLDLRNNQHTRMPFELQNMRTLQWVDLRGNPISADAIANLKSALPYCTILSDLDTKIPGALKRTPPTGKPLIPAAASTFSLPSPIPLIIGLDGERSTVTIPGQALLQANNKPYTGDAVLKHASYHSLGEILLSGYPLLYDSVGYEQYMGCLGIVDIQDIYQAHNSEKLKISQELSVSLTDQLPGKVSTAVYRFDPVLREWRHIGNDTMVYAPRENEGSSQAALPMPRPQFRYIMAKEQISVRLAKVRQEQSFTIYFENYTSSAQVNAMRAANTEGHSLSAFDMQAFAGTTWLYDGTQMAMLYDSLSRKGRITYNVENVDDLMGNRKYRIYHTRANDVRIMPNPNGEDNFSLSLYQDGQLLISIPVLPLKRGDDPYRIQKRLGSQYRKYKKLREEKDILWETAQARYDSAYAVYESEVEQYKLHRRPGSYTSSFMHSFPVNGTGIYSCSFTYAYAEPAYASIKQVKAKTGEKLQLRRTWLLDLDHYGVRSVDAEHFIYDRKGRFALVGEIDDQTLAVFPEGEFRQAVTTDDQNMDIRLKVITTSDRTVPEIIDELGL